MICCGNKIIYWGNKIICCGNKIVCCGNKISFLWEQNNKLWEQDIVLREENKKKIPHGLNQSPYNSVLTESLLCSMKFIYFSFVVLVSICMTVFIIYKLTSLNLGNHLASVLTESLLCYNLSNYSQICI